MSFSRPHHRLTAGAATVDITPQGSVFLFGYPHVPRQSTGIHDRLECSALYLRSGDAELLFLSNDLIFVPQPVVTEVRRLVHALTGVPARSILISATHTHSGPVTAAMLGNAADPVVPKPSKHYLDWLVSRMASAACRAHEMALPAEAGLKTAQAVGVGTNRHDPSGPADPEVPVLVVRNADTQRTMACLLVYGMHPTVLHEDSTLISADFPHFTRRYLQHRVFQEECPVLWHNGASGDQSPRHVAKAQTFAEARRLGENLGKAVAQVIPEIEFRDDLVLHSRRTLVDLIPRVFPSVQEAQKNLEQKRAVFEALRRKGAAKQAVRTAECDVFGAEETAELAQAAKDGRLAATLRDYTPVEIQVLEVGPWRFVGWPGEFFVEYALALKRRAANAFLITLANGELQGYIVTKEAETRGCYEALNAVFAAENGARFVEATVALLQSAHD